MAFNISSKIRAIVEFDVVKETIEIIAINADYLSNLLRDQLAVGEDGNGKSVTVFGNTQYQPVTVWNKRQAGVGLGRVTEWITNFMTGDFYAGIHPLTDGKKLIFKSEVPYYEDIITQSGGSIMKLNDFHLNKFKQEILIPELDKRLKQRNGGF